MGGSRIRKNSALPMELCATKRRLSVCINLPAAQTNSRFDPDEEILSCSAVSICRT